LFQKKKGRGGESTKSFNAMQRRRAKETAFRVLQSRSEESKREWDGFSERLGNCVLILS